MKVLVRVWKDDHDIFKFEASTHDEFDLADVVTLALDDFVAQHPKVSLTDPGVHFTIRDANDPGQT